MNNWLETGYPVDHALNIDVKDFCLSNPMQDGITQLWNEKVGVWQLPAEHIFKKQWLQETNKYFNVDITGGLIFYRTPKYQHPGAHTDVDPQNGVNLPVIFSYNWVMQEDSLNPMVWYKPYSGELDSDVDQGSMAYKEWPTEILERESEHCLSHDQITMCRTDIPHNVDMNSENERWCITARCWGHHQKDPWQTVYEEHLCLKKKSDLRLR